MPQNLIITQKTTYEVDEKGDITDTIKKGEVLWQKK